MQRRILIVDDIKSNREILKNILADKYEIIEAAHGMEAVAVMDRDYKNISAVLLDLGMPVMDGFEVLSHMRESKELSQLPVIVMTGQTDSDSEEKALKLGAKDYISKPYKASIVRQRIWNTIDLKETAATINAMQRDRLTGLYSREAFFDKVTDMVSSHEAGYYIMAGFDIDNFKVINDQYGTSMGDEVLKYIAKVFREGFNAHGGICCRIMADNFAVLYPASFADSKMLEEIRARAGNVEGLVSPITFSIGRYIVDDPTISPSAMYDRATLAENTVKGMYDQSIALYDESMREYLLREQKVVSEMVNALKNGQFEAWFQPQYNHSSGAMIGAEALVRWRHPEGGLISPAAFIPIFEKNGFIYELDKYIWEEVCRYLQKWRAEGLEPLPVSVNISRYDLFKPELADVLAGLIRKYDIPVEMLRLEITESAFAKSTEQIVEIVKKLIDSGFTVEIDDFGSGYSSLNTLKSVPAQVIKLDMHFLDDENDASRSGNILESIVRMTKWLGMSIIAEGVEEPQQADFLKSIGCCYVQGYLYARPMSAGDYEAHCRDAGGEERLLTIETVSHLDNNAFWDAKSIDTLIFNSYVGAACILEYNKQRLELLRANDNYAKMLCGEKMTVDELLKLDVFSYLDKKTRSEKLAVIAESAKDMKEINDEWLFIDLPGGPHETFIRIKMRVIAMAGSRCLIYCINENITAQRMAERSERKLIKQLQEVMGNVSCGITAVSIDGQKVEYIFRNDRYFEILGYTKEQFEREVGDKPTLTIHPAERERVIEKANRVSITGKAAVFDFRAIRRDKNIVWLRCSSSMTDFEGVESRVQLSVYTDVTAEKQAAQELLDNLPGGAALYEYDGNELTVIHMNLRYWELVDRAPLDYDDISVMTSVYPDDRAVLTNEIAMAVSQKRNASCDIRLLYGLNEYRLFHVEGRVTPKKGGKYSIYASYTPITDEAMYIRDMLPVALRTMIDTHTGFSFIKDKNLKYVCCSSEVAQMVGMQSESEVIGKTDYDLIDKTIADKYAAVDQQVLACGEPVIDSIDVLPSKDGTERYSSTSKFPLKDSQGNTIGIYGVGCDVTEARAMSSRLELLTNSIPGGIAVYECRPEALDKVKLQYFSDGLCKMLGYSREEYEKLSANNAFGQVAAEDIPVIKKHIEALAKDNTPIDCVYRLKAKRGDGKWINLKAVAGEMHDDNMTIKAVLFDVTEQQEALEKLRISEEVNRIAIEHGKNVVCRYDVKTRTLAVSPSVDRIFQTGPFIEDVPYGQVKEGFISAETSADYIKFYESILRGEPTGKLTYQRKSTEGWRWLEAHSTTIFSGEGKPVSAVISFFDVTDKLKKEAVYKKWQQSIQDKKPESYSLFRCNVSKKTSIDSPEGELIDLAIVQKQFNFDEQASRYAMQRVFEEDRENFIDLINVDSLLASYYQGRRIVTVIYREALPEGDVKWLRLTVDLVEHPHSTDVEAYMLFEDIDEAKRAELETAERAENDPLTGVLNRTTLAQKVNTALRTSKPDARHALMMIDIDGFKQVNDVFGHYTGDQTLIDIACSLSSVLRHDDLVGRIGGDEFVVFLMGIPDDAIAANKAKQICALVRRSFSTEVEITGSVGITIAPRDGAEFDTLYQKADAALYNVKVTGKDNFAFFAEEMSTEPHRVEEKEMNIGFSKKRKRRMLIVDDSRSDLAMMAYLFEDEFNVVKAKDGNTALIRLRHYGSTISVVLLDLLMMGIDGFNVLERMQQSAELRSIPVIVISSDESRETSLRAIQCGATDYIQKPIDVELLRVRVNSAILKAENSRRRAKSNYLDFQNSEVARYKTVLNRGGITVIEHDWIKGEFIYDANISDFIAGSFDERRLWHILLADFVADTGTVKKMQELIHDIATDRQKTDDVLFVRLKTPSEEKHWFRMSVYKVANMFGLTGKIYLAFCDLGTEWQTGNEPYKPPTAMS